MERFFFFIQTCGWMIRKCVDFTCIPCVTFTQFALFRCKYSFNTYFDTSILSLERAFHNSTPSLRHPHMPASGTSPSQPFPPPQPVRTWGVNLGWLSFTWSNSRARTAHCTNTNFIYDTFAPKSSVKFDIFRVLYPISIERWQVWPSARCRFPGGIFFEAPNNEVCNQHSNCVRKHRWKTFVEIRGLNKAFRFRI